MGKKEKNCKKRKRAKNESENDYECDEDEEYLPEPKKRKLKKRNKKIKREVLKKECGLMIPSSIGRQCFSLEEQRCFGEFMVFAAAPKLYELANIVCPDKEI